MLNKLQQKVTKLQSSLDLQMHMQTELESELKEKNKEIDARGNEVSQCMKIFPGPCCSKPDYVPRISENFDWSFVTFR